MSTIDQITVDMMADTKTWPMFPSLPLKKPSDDIYETPLAVCFADNPLIVSVVPGMHELIGKSINQVREEYETKEYETVEDLMQAGWVVD